MQTDDPQSQVGLVIEPDGGTCSISDILIARGLPAFIIGSSEKAHLRLTDAGLAPGHAAVRLQDGRYLLQALPGAACAVNGQPVLRGTFLSPGDVIDLGGVQLRFTGEAAASVTAAACPVPRPVAAVPASMPIAPAPALRQTAAPAPVVSQAAAPTIHYANQAAPAPVNLSGLLYLGIGLISVILLAVAGVALFPRQTAEAEMPLEFAYNDGSVTLVMFEADWCTYCAQQKPIVNGLADEFRGRVYVRMVDIDAPSNSSLVSRYGARSVPMLVILDDMGQVTEQYFGLTDGRIIRRGIQDALVRSAQTPNNTPPPAPSV